MALTPEQIADILFKKISAGVADSSTAKAFFEEPVLSRISVFADQIWAEADQIPISAPEESTDYVEKVTDAILDPIPGSTSSFVKDGLRDIIPFNYGDGTYNYELKDSAGNPIAFGQNDWYLDPESGVLTFFNGVPGNMPPTLSCYKYIGQKGIVSQSNNNSGYLVVNLRSDLYPDGLTQGAFEGQLAVIKQTNEVYMWTTDTTIDPPVSSWKSIVTSTVAQVPLASTGRLGIVKLSTPNREGTDPIVVETNDPRMNDSRVPKLHASTHYSDDSLDRIPDASATNAGLMSKEMFDRINNVQKFPYPLDKKLRGQYVSEVYDATQTVAPFSELNLTVRALAENWTFTSSETKKGIITPPHELSKIYLYTMDGEKLVDSSTSKEIYARIINSDGAVKLKYYTKSSTGEDPYEFQFTPTEPHRAKVPRLFDLWDMPTFDPTLAAPGTVPDTVPHATSTIFGVVTVGGTGASAAAPNSHTELEEDAHGGFVSSIKVNADEEPTPNGQVIFRAGQNMTITRAGNEITFASSGGTTETTPDTGGGGGGGGGGGVVSTPTGPITVAKATTSALGVVKLSYAPLDPNNPIVLSANDPNISYKNQDSVANDGVRLSTQNLVIREQVISNIENPVIGQIVRSSEDELLYERTSEGWELVDKPHANEHLPGGKDPIALASTATAGLMSSYFASIAHTKEDTTSLVNKKKAALTLGGSLTGISGSSVNVTSYLSGSTPSTSTSQEGIVVFSPNNKVTLVDTSSGQILKSGLEEVFGRLTHSSGTWTLSFYKLVGGAETATSVSDVDISWYVQRIYNLHNLPIFDAAVSIPTGIVMGDVTDATDTGKGVVYAGGTGTESNRVPTYTQLKEHVDKTDAHGGIVNSIAVYPIGTSGISGSGVSLKGGLNLFGTSRLNISVSGNSIYLDSQPGFYPDKTISLTAVNSNKPNLVLTPGAFPTTGLQAGSVHVDNSGQLWVNPTGASGDQYWKVVGGDYSIERFVVGGSTGISVYTGVIIDYDGKVIQATSLSPAGDNRAIGIVVAVDGGGTTASPGKTVFVKIDGLVKNALIYNTAQAGDYLILKPGILGKVFSLGATPSPYTIGRALKSSQNGYVDMMVVRISGGVGASGTRIIDEWDKESASYADGVAPYPRTADSNGLYRYYLSREPLINQDVVVVASNVRQPKNKYRVRQDLDQNSSNYQKWYVALKYPLMLDTDTVFVEYFTA